jgi:hypothetical protein
MLLVARAFTYMPRVRPAACCVLAILTAATGVALSAPDQTNQPVKPALVVRTASDETLHDRLWAMVPSATENGETIVVPAQEVDSARGNPNLKLLVWNRHKLLRSVIVQAVDQCRYDPHHQTVFGASCTAAEDAQVTRQERKAGKFVDALALQPLFSLEPDPATSSREHTVYTTANVSPRSSPSTCQRPGLSPSIRRAMP